MYAALSFESKHHDTSLTDTRNEPEDRFRGRDDLRCQRHRRQQRKTQRKVDSLFVRLHRYCIS